MNSIKKTVIEEYWLKKLSGDLPKFSLSPVDGLTKGNIENQPTISIELEVPGRLTGKLKKIARDSDIGLFILVLSGLNIALHKYTGIENLIVGTLPPAPDAKQKNVLFCRNRMSSQSAVKDIINQTKRDLLEAVKYSDFSMAGILDDLQAKNNNGSLNIFNAAFVHGHLQRKDAFLNRFDLVFGLSENRGKMVLVIENPSSSYAGAMVERFGRNVINVLEGMVENPGQKAALLDVVSTEEKQRLLYEFNKTEVEYPADKTVARSFEEQAARTPDRIALVGPSVGGDRRFSRSVTYRELYEKSRRLAETLRYKGVDTRSIVGLMVQRSVEMITGMLAILNAGGAYLPIDPGFPMERIEYMLNDSGAGVLVTDGTLVEEGKTPGNREGETILIEEDSLPVNAPHATDPAIRPASTDPAYVIYTSGTTGRPKGVIIENRSVVNFIKGITDVIPFRENDSILALTTISFDIFGLETLLPLTRGSKIVVGTEEARLDAALAAGVMEKEGITIFQATPSRLHLFIFVREADASLRGLDYLIVGGEALPPALLEELRKRVSGKIYNVYGPTETTIWSTIKDVGGEEPLNIGKPIANTFIDILSREGLVQPLGVAGELCIAGDGVGRGYLNRPDLTAERFNRSYRTHISYKTGDMARWLEDGNIECLGRIDHQVKIRGFRIEPGEIENQLLKHNDVKKAAVAVVENEWGDKSLAAYFVSDGEPSGGELREYLRSTLPDYMVPSAIMQLDAFPLTPSGKIDRKALPAPVFDSSEEYIAPSGPVEEALVNIWSEVLGIETSVVGIDANFFNLGGHSLKLTILLGRIHQELDVKVPLEAAFKSPTVRGLAKYIKSAVKEKSIPIETAEKREYYPLSSSQKRLFVLQRLEGDTIGHNLPSAMMLVGKPDKDRLEQSFRRMIARHESFRTSFEMIGDQPVQRIHENVEFEIEYYDSGTTLEEFRSGILKDFIRPFDLSRAPLLRVGLVKLDESRHILMKDFHHIVYDGTSLVIFYRDFLKFYNGKELPDMRVQYKDYSQWQTEPAVEEIIKKQEVYWVKEFEGEIPVLELPLDHARPRVWRYEGSEVEFEIGREETKALKALALKEESTLFILLLAAYNILLSRLSGQEDIVVGTPIAGRYHPDVQDIVGVFLNSLALRNFPSFDRTCLGFLREVKERTLTSMENQDYQFENLVDKVVVNRDLSRNPLFDAMLILHTEFDNAHTNIPEDEQVDFKVERFGYEKGISEFDLTLVGVEKAETLGLKFQYSTNLFKKETVERWVSYFENILTGVLREPGTKLSRLEIIPREEKRRILEEFNRTEVEYPADKTIPQLFEQQVERTPDRVALVGASVKEVHRFPQNMTYRELNEKSRRLAVLLKGKGVGTNTVVGIMVERSVEMIVSILGVLRAGGAYLPIGPAMPMERIKYMVEHSGTGIVLTGQPVDIQGLQDGAELVDINEIGIDGPVESGFPPAGDSRDMAYVMYTSGTTGNPKGVIIEHRSLVNFIKGITDIIPFGIDDGVLSLTTISFDIFGLETLLPLTKGSKVVIGSMKEQLNTAAAGAVIEKEKVSIFQVTPSRLQLWMADDGAKSSLGRLKHLLVGGESFPGQLLEQVRSVMQGKIYNVYGPTETTIWSTVKDVSGENVLNIGKPIANTRIYILGKTGCLQPIGAVGELCIGGDGLARGYLHNEALTGEKFIDNPVVPGERIYKTGDLAVWTSGGDIECLGRVDHQVKIRGFRVELEEIEEKIKTGENIKDAVVLIEGEADKKYLSAYIVADGEPDISELRRYLAGSLPDYMIPSYFIKIHRIPLSPSGKVDRRALDKLGGQRLKAGSSYVAPSTDIEKIIAELWKEVLKLDNVGIHDNFFEMGGNSINLIQLNGKLAQAMKRDIPVVVMFRYLTINSFTQYLQKENRRASESVTRTKNDEQSRANRSRERYGRAVKRFKQGVKQNDRL